LIYSIHQLNLKKKLKKAFCEPGNIENNGVLAFCKSVIFPLIKGEELILPRAEQYGGPISFNDYTQLENAFAKQDIHPGDLKNGVEAYINRLLDPIRKEFESEEMQKLIENAYPSPSTAKKKCSTINNSIIIKNQ